MSFEVKRRPKPPRANLRRNAACAAARRLDDPISPHHWLLLLLLGALSACANPTAHADRIASAARLNREVIQGAPFRHLAFASEATGDGTLWVFIEGDGSPWTRNGMTPAVDPTPHHPLALELAARTSGAVLYLGRPCYFSVRSDVPCSPDLWTAARYSRLVVDSMAAALNRFVAERGCRRVVLIGYSGGGTLAVLLAPRVPSATAVVTIAGNLDVAAWTDWHGYLPLQQSLNPANEAPLAPDLAQWHLIGGRDDNVPEYLSRRYLAKVREDRIRRYAKFDHVCCWVQQWPEIFAQLATEIAAR